MLQLNQFDDIEFSFGNWAKSADNPITRCNFRYPGGGDYWLIVVICTLKWCLSWSEFDSTLGIQLRDRSIKKKTEFEINKNSPCWRTVFYCSE